MQHRDTPPGFIPPDKRSYCVTQARSNKNERSIKDNGIIGNSPAVHVIMEMVAKVASSDSTVLILGETGTGKELIARAIHQHSPRSGKPMIKVNCGALPANLVESELFGHEKGSFTGAIEKRIGKFELAHGSTLFLDEVGEMPLELQVKLLRVLQEKEFERVGGRTSIETDVRIIAATNRNLENEMQAGRFRADLYYRLNVFPVFVPPLRERREDIPVLAGHFLQHYCTREKKSISAIPPDCITQLTNYHWPGNIRELENIVARSVLLSSGNDFCPCAIASCLQYTGQSAAVMNVKTISENEKEHILKTLAVCNHKIYGPGGAATLLHINPSTLMSRMKKLGISRKFTD